jgi:putative hydrolase of the HAD superfamily
MIKNIIFDFGDVFLNLDKPATAREMLQYGFTEITAELDTLFKDYEKGVVSSASFLDHTEKLFPRATKQNLIDAWNAILLDFPEYRLDFLEKLAHSKTYRLFLLSNTNDLHIAHVRANMGAERFNRFKDCFEVFYLSYEMGMRKPDTEIFDFVLQENELISEETLFIDDTKENIDTAATLGIKTWHLQVGNEDVTDLKNHL